MIFTQFGNVTVSATAPLSDEMRHKLEMEKAQARRDYSKAKFLTVKDLMDTLAKCPPDMPVGSIGDENDPYFLSPVGSFGVQEADGYVECTDGVERRVIGKVLVIR